jgi:hypothetical protein
MFFIKVKRMLNLAGCSLNIYEVPESGTSDRIAKDLGQKITIVITDCRLPGLRSTYKYRIPRWNSWRKSRQKS